MSKDNESKSKEPKVKEFCYRRSAKFNGKNYDLWEQAVRTTLKVKNKVAFIDGKIIKLIMKEGEYSKLMLGRWLTPWWVHGLWI